jgi:hypothetical protein
LGELLLYEGPLPLEPGETIARRGLCGNRQLYDAAPDS